MKEQRITTYIWAASSELHIRRIPDPMWWTRIHHLLPILLCHWSDSRRSSQICRLSCFSLAYISSRILSSTTLAISRPRERRFNISGLKRASSHNCPKYWYRRILATLSRIQSTAERCSSISAQRKHLISFPVNEPLEVGLRTKGWHQRLICSLLRWKEMKFAASSRNKESPTWITVIILLVVRAFLVWPPYRVVKALKALIYGVSPCRRPRTR